MSDPAEGPRQVGEMVEAGVDGMNILSLGLIFGVVAVAALVVWISVSSVGEWVRDRRRR